MSLWNEITEIYPELTNEDFHPNYGKIMLCNDGDGVEYIFKWEYEKPIPEGLTLGKP